MAWFRFPQAVSIGVFVAMLAACGGGGSSSGGGSSGGGGGDGGSSPPPAPAPPVFTTPTAVRVSQPTPFRAGCLAIPGGSTAYVNSEVEPHLAVDPSNPNHLIAAWQQDRLSDGGAQGLAGAVSVDGGITWSAPRALPFSQCAAGDYQRASDPWVSVSASSAFFIGIAFSANPSPRSAVLVSRSGDGGFNWGAPVVLADDDASVYFNDKETITADSTDARNVYAIWYRFDGDGICSDRFARSQDGGISWEPAFTIYEPDVNAQNLGHVILVSPDGTVHNFFTELTEDSAGHVSGRLKVMSSSDQGSSWSSPTLIGELLAVETRDPARPGVAVRGGEAIGSFAVNPVDGTLYAVWQDSRFTSGAHNAVVIAWSRDGGKTWTSPVAINADLAVPAFTPAVAVLPNGTIGVTYYDFRMASTLDTRPTDFWIAFSRDGDSWRELRLAGNFDLLNAPSAQTGRFLGDYTGLVAQGTGTFVSLYSRVNNGDTANRTDVFADRTDATTVAGAVSPGAGYVLQKTRAPVWNEAAQGRVERHLAQVFDERRRMSREWFKAPAEPAVAPVSE